MSFKKSERSQEIQPLPEIRSLWERFNLINQLVILEERAERLTARDPEQVQVLMRLIHEARSALPSKVLIVKDADLDLLRSEITSLRSENSSLKFRDPIFVELCSILFDRNRSKFSRLIGISKFLKKLPM